MSARAIFFQLILIPVMIMIAGQLSFSQTVEDTEGNSYPVIKAGNLWWMAENLRVSIDPEGNHLEYYRIENPYMDSSNYGFLYSWTTAMDSAWTPGSRGICPEGWHLPTDAEWDSLIAWAGGVNMAGAVLKRQGPDHFNALMSGNFNPISEIHSYFGEQAYFWTSDSYNCTYAWMRHVGSEVRNINRSTVGKHYGFSIRCVRTMN
jgi:uncharacterized protein (TIGR02145 family)